MSQFYPALNQLIKVDALPESIRSKISDILSKLFYKSYYSEKSIYGDTAFHQITIVINSELGLNLFGGEDGFEILFNPGVLNGTTEIPISLEYNIPVLRYVRTIQDLSSPSDYFDLLLKIVNANENRILLSCIQTFHNNSIQSFIDQFNLNPDFPSLVTTISGNDDEVMHGIVAEFEQNEIGVLGYILEEYILISGDLEGSFDNLFNLFANIIGSITKEDILKLLIPKFSVLIQELEIALAFPESILKPIDANGNLLNDGTKSKLSYEVGGISYHSEKGIEFINPDDTFELTPSQIGNTGLTLALDGIKFDFRSDKNIPEADADNRPLSFKGVYIEEATIGLPKGWTSDSTNAPQVKIVGRNLLIGNPGGFSGTVGLEGGNLSTSFAGGATLSLTGFSLTFGRPAPADPNAPLADDNSIHILSSSITGKLKIPSLKDSAGNEAEITITGSYTEEGFSITGTEPQGIVFKIPNFADLIIKEVSIAYNSIEDEYSFTFKGQLKFTSTLPIIGKMLPDVVDINNITVTSEPKLETFDIGFKWTGANGFVLSADGQGNASVDIPVNRTIADILTISTIKGTLSTSDSKLDIGISGSLELGPFTGTVEGVGLQGLISYNPNGGNVGPLDFKDFKIKPPTGIGIVIDSKGFKGAGFLSFDYEKGRYVGALELSIKDKISIKAIAIIVTKLPSGKDGFSLLLLITAEFQPVSLGFGFTLNGVGGLIALHRTTNLDALRDGVKSNTLDNILFPDNPVENITVIVSDLEKVFPIQEGRHTFGIMALIGWGTPTLITAELGLVLEVPSPVKLALLGVIKAILPDENNPRIKLQINFLGTIDFEKKFITFDASLYDSKVLSMTLSGDMAFRLKYGSNSNFLLTIGGFHPSYTPPPLQLPTINRLTLGLLTGNPSVTLSCYFAVTSNTVQVGARADLLYTLGKYKVIGYIGFDALFQFSPFYFIIEAGAMFAVKKGEDTKLSISLNFKLSGPTPWNVAGSATFELLKLNFEVSFNKTWGDSDTTSLPDIAIRPLIVAAIKDKKNWRADLPENKYMLVSLRNVAVETDKIILHPFGILQVSQNIAPLNTAINKFGNQIPSGGRYFEFKDVKIFTTAVPTSSIGKIQEEFAPAQFFQMSDSEKVIRPSFEKLDSGINFKGTSTLAFSKFLKKELIHETIFIDSGNLTTTMSPTNRITTSKNAFNAEVKGGAISKSSLSYSKKNTDADPAQKVMSKSERYAVVTKDDMRKYNNTSIKNSRSEAEVLLKQIFSNYPKFENELQIVPEFEVNTTIE